MNEEVLVFIVVCLVGTLALLGAIRAQGLVWLLLVIVGLLSIYFGFTYVDNVIR